MIQVYINKPVMMDAVDFYIIRIDQNSGKRYLLTLGKHNQQMVELKEYQETPEPTFRLSGGTSTEILKALADALDQQGIKTDADSKIEGKLEAVNQHLEDMRKLVFGEKINANK